MTHSRKGIFSQPLLYMTDLGFLTSVVESVPSRSGLSIIVYFPGDNFRNTIIISKRRHLHAVNLPYSLVVVIILNLSFSCQYRVFPGCMQLRHDAFILRRVLRPLVIQMYFGAPKSFQVLVVDPLS